MRKPTVLFINRVYPPAKGATGRVLRDLAQSFAADGWDVNIITTGAKNQDVKEGPIFIRRVKANARKVSVNYLWTWVKLFNAARKFKRTDLIVTLTDPPMLVVAGRILARWKKSTHIHWCQDLYPDILPVLDMKFPKPLMRFLSRTSQAALRSCDHVVAIGRCMGDYLVQIGVDAKKLTVIPNWPDRELFQASARKIESLKPANDRDENAKPLFINTNPRFRVLYAGNLGRAHPVTTILEAASILQISNPEIEFIFVGEGPGHEHLAAERTRRGLENVRLLPTQPAFQLKEMMQSGDVHLISMKHEATGLIVPSKLYSALAAERPCILIGPEQSETAHVIKDYHAGSVIAQGNPVALADTIIQYRMDGSKWFEAHKGARRASEDFGASGSIKNWINCARSAIRYPAA